MDSMKWVWLFLRSRKTGYFGCSFYNSSFRYCFLDYDLNVNSVLYIIILNIGLSCIFLLFTYLKEVKFYKHLDDNIEPEALKHKSLADTPFQEEMLAYLYHQITTQKV